MNPFEEPTMIDNTGEREAEEVLENALNFFRSGWRHAASLSKDHSVGFFLTHQPFEVRCERLDWAAWVRDYAGLQRRLGLSGCSGDGRLLAHKVAETGQ